MLLVEIYLRFPCTIWLKITGRIWLSCVPLWKVRPFSPTGFGEPGADRGRHMAGAAVTVWGAAGLTDQSKAGGRGRGWAMQTGKDVTEMFSCICSYSKLFSHATLVWCASEFIGAELHRGRATPHQINPSKQNQGSRGWNPKTQEPGQQPHTDAAQSRERPSPGNGPQFLFFWRKEPFQVELLTYFTLFFPPVDEQDH